MENIITIVILLFVVGSACFYIRKEKKQGKKCIGCPMSVNGSCPGHCNSRKETNLLSHAVSVKKD